MARVKISEYDAKRILLPNFVGLSATPKTTLAEIKRAFPDTNLVVKVDQGIKKRGLQGLVKVNVLPRDIPPLLKKWSVLGWSQFLIEPVIEHASSAEHYVALERIRDGWQVSYSDLGGIDVESNWDSVKTTLAQNSTAKELVAPFLPLMEKNHIVFLEMNPVVIRAGKVIPLDMACEVDSAGANIAPIPDRSMCEVERQVAVLDAGTPASLKFHLINPNGSIWMLLSGGGASLVLADEVADQGMGGELANYGEYSGAPSTDDVASYTRLVLSALIKSSSKKKVLVIAGGVANFTDVASTFKGIILALTAELPALQKSGLKVYVRRGGPNEKQGLKTMSEFLKSSGLYGSVHGHETPLTKVVTELKKS